jgi:cytochrome c oxidase subunit 4
MSATASRHAPSARLYYAVFAALIAFTALTVWVATIDLGRMNVVVALTIACAKALLVVLFFMHARHSSRLTWVFIGAGVFWFLILIAFTMSDYASRPWL